MTIRYLSDVISEKTTLSLMIAARAHGLDTGFLDAWEPEKDLDKIFDVDLKRYIPEGVLWFGKSVGPVHNCCRRDLKDAAEFL